MPFGNLTRFAIIILLGTILLPGGAAAETYVIPLWARALPASDGQWWTQALIVNPHPFPVALNVVGVFPLATVACDTCTPTIPPVTVEPFSSTVLAPPSGLPGQSLVAGAVELRTSARVHIHLVAYRLGGQELRQRLDVAQEWLPSGHHTISGVERGGQTWRINVFIANPSSKPLRASVWALRRSENERTITVPPNSTAVVALPTTLCNGAPCSFPAGFPPAPLRVEVEADGPFLASVSSITDQWAVFAIADEATR